uniref:Glycosyltransferase, GlcNAc n=1 Tax=Peronospora matthiolae TaxID=2874970 RepID=A0AAV1U1R3_9STRA
MLSFVKTAAVLAGLTVAKVDVNPGKEISFSTIWWNNWTNSTKLNPRVQHIPLDPEQSHLRPPPADIPATFDMFIGSSAYRDGYRCGKTLFTAFKRATYPERLHFGILEQIYEGDPTCLDEYCKLAAEEWSEDESCRYQDLVTVDTRDAAESAGCTTARHLQQKLIGDQEFCLQVDAHTIFTNRWDEDIVADWRSINNEMAIMTTYPHHSHDYMIKENGDNAIQNSIPHLCMVVKGETSNLTRIARASMISDSWAPQMAALWGGGYSFSKCHAERKVLVDSHTPWLWDGEEFLRSANYWTNGYDLYSPSRLGHVLYHNYSAKPASFWKAPVDPVKKSMDAAMARNRVRLRLGMPFKGVVDTFEFDKYGFGKVRSFAQYLKFANISFEGWMNETNSCGQLHWVPYENATEVEMTVGHGWKLHSQDENKWIAESTMKKTREADDFDVELHEFRGVLTLSENASYVTSENAKTLDAKLRQGVHEFGSTCGLPVVFFVIAVIATVFVALSSNIRSNAIRRRVCLYLKNRRGRNLD